jgi:hypothetical protein
MDEFSSLPRRVARFTALASVIALSACGAADEIVTGAIFETPKPAPAAVVAAAQPEPQIDTRTEGEKMAQEGDALAMEGRDLIAEGQARIAQGERMAAEGKRIREEERAGHVGRDRRHVRQAN